MSILSVAAALVVTNLTPVVVTSASWNDSEWSHGEVGTLSCADDGNFKTRGGGRLLGGDLMSLDLDSVVALEGMTATNDGANSRSAPAVPADPQDTYQNSLDVNALSTIELPVVEGEVDAVLSSVLTLSEGTDQIGVVNQYAHATSTGISEGASGVIADSGAILNPGSEGLPALGTLELSSLVKSLTGEAISDIVAGITDLQLEIGAVASRATVDACETAWTDDIDSTLTREYAMAGLGASIEAPVVGDLSGTLTGLLDGLQTSLNGLASDAGVLSAITGGVGSLLSGTLGTLNLGTIGVTGPAITIDLSSVRDLATASVSDDAGAVMLDLATGQVRVDLASLIGEAYGGQGFNGTQAHGLNGLPPNTELLVNDDVTNALVAALTQALDGWVADVLDTLESAVYAAHVNVALAIRLGGTVLGSFMEVASVNVTVNGSLGSLLDGTATVNAGLSLLGGECRTGLEVVPCLIAGLVNPLVSGILSALTGGVGPLVGGILETAILGESGLVPALGSTLSAATSPVITALSSVLGGVLGVDGLVSLRVNVQNDAAAGNDPDPAPSLTYPDWEDAPSAVPDDQYDVAALSIGVLNALGTTSNVNLELARSSVGVSCAVGGVWDADGRCDDY